ALDAGLRRVACDEDAEPSHVLAVEVAVELIDVLRIERCDVLELEDELARAVQVAEVGQERCLTVVVEDDVSDVGTTERSFLLAGEVELGVERGGQDIERELLELLVRSAVAAGWQRLDLSNLFLDGRESERREERVWGARA